MVEKILSWPFIAASLFSGLYRWFKCFPGCHGKFRGCHTRILVCHTRFLGCHTRARPGCHTSFLGCHTRFLGCHTRAIETKNVLFVVYPVYFLRVYPPFHGIAETRKKICMENLATMVRSCNENFVWRVWNHIWLLDMVAKKGQHGVKTGFIEQWVKEKNV